MRRRGVVFLLVAVVGATFVAIGGCVGDEPDTSAPGSNDASTRVLSANERQALFAEHGWPR